MQLCSWFSSHGSLDPPVRSIIKNWTALADGRILFKPIRPPCLPRLHYWQEANVISIAEWWAPWRPSVGMPPCILALFSFYAINKSKCLSQQSLRCSETWLTLMPGSVTPDYSSSDAFSRTITSSPWSGNMVTPYYSEAVNQLYWITSQPWPSPSPANQ